MDKYIAAISGVQMTVAGGILALLLEGNSTVWLLGMTSVLLGNDARRGDGTRRSPVERASEALTGFDAAPRF